MPALNSPERDQPAFIALAKLLGYPEIPKGLCNGYAHMMNQAVLVGEEEKCKQRVTRINSTAPEKLIADIELAKQKRLRIHHGSNEQLTEQDQIDLEIPAAFDFMMQYQQRFSFKRFSWLSDLLLYYKNPVNYRHSMEALTSSQKMDALMNAHHHVSNNSYPEIYSGMTVGAYTHEEMNQYFASLLRAVDATLNATDEPIVMHVASYSHAVSLSYHPKDMNWCLADISKSHNLDDSETSDDETLAETLSTQMFSSFCESEAKYLILKVSFATTPKGRANLDACLRNWMQDPVYDTLHTITPEKSHRLDSSAWVNLKDFLAGFSRIYWNRDYTSYVKALKNIRDQEMKIPLSIMAVAGIVGICLIAVGFAVLTFPISIPVIATFALAASALLISMVAGCYLAIKNKKLNANPEKANTANFNQQHAEVWRVLEINTHVATPSEGSQLQETAKLPIVDSTSPTVVADKLERSLSR